MAAAPLTTREENQPLQCKWVSENIRWKKKLQKLEELCLQHPKKLVQTITDKICMCQSKDYFIARGSPGTAVYLGFITNDWREVAVKRILNDGQFFNRGVVEEVKALVGLMHPNIVDYKMLAKDKTYIYIAVELCDYTLAKWFKQEKVQHLTKEIWRMKSVDLIRDLLCGLEHMHAKRMLHRDLKPQNLFVVQHADGSQCLKIGDFDLTRGLENDKSTVRTVDGGTTYWLPKEVIVQLGDSESTDSESTDSESTDSESTDSESTANESTDNESTAIESTDNESTAIESTDNESTVSESIDNESTASESIDNESTATESTDSMPKIKYKKAGEIQVAGMVCHYIMTRGKHPYAPLDHELHTRVVKGQYNLSHIEHDSLAYDLISSMLADDPEARLPAEQLQRHLYLWSDKDRYEFIVAVAKEDAVHKSHEEPHKSSEFVMKLEDTKSNVFQNGKDWEGLSIVPVYRAEAANVPRYTLLYSTDSTKSVCKLIRAMRNIQEHYVDQPETVKDELGDKDEKGVHTFCYSKAFSYFHTNFESLVLETYRVVKEFPEKKKLLSDFPHAGNQTKKQTEAPPSTSDAPPSASDAPPSTSDALPSTSDELLSTSDAPTSDAPTSDAPPSTSDELLSTSDAPPPTSDAPPSTSDALPSTSDELLSTSDAPTSDAPPSTSDAPPSTSDELLSTSDAPPSTSDAPPSTSDAPLSTSDAPPSTSDTTS